MPRLCRHSAQRPYAVAPRRITQFSFPIPTDRPRSIEAGICALRGAYPGLVQGSTHLGTPRVHDRSGLPSASRRRSG